MRGPQWQYEWGFAGLNIFLRHPTEYWASKVECMANSLSLLQPSSKCLESFCPLPSIRTCHYCRLQRLVKRSRRRPRMQSRCSTNSDVVPLQTEASLERTCQFADNFDVIRLYGREKVTRGLVVGSDYNYQGYSKRKLNGEKAYC